MPMHLYLIGLCFLASLLFVGKKDWLNRATPVFLLLLFCVELYCYQLKEKHLGNNAEYNAWFPIEFSFYIAVIISRIVNPALKRKYYVLFACYGLFVVVNYIFFQDHQKFSGSSYMVSLVMLLLAAFAKMKELVYQPEITNPFHEPFFWLIIGLITVHLLGVFQFSATDYLHSNYLPVYRALQRLNLYLSYFQYTCMLAYFFTKWKYQS